MQSVNIKRIQDSKDIERILFERPISRLHAKKVGLIVGKRSEIKSISDAYEIIHSLGHDVVIIAEDKTMLNNIPATIFLESQKKLSSGFSNADQAIELLSECEYVIINQGIDFSSRMEIFLTKLFLSNFSNYIFLSNGLTIPKFIPLGMPLESNNILVCDYSSLNAVSKKLGITKKISDENTLSYKIGLLFDVSKFSKLSIVCVGKNQIIGLSHGVEDSIAVVNVDFASSNLKNIFTPILAGILSDDSKSSEDLLNRVLTSGYILNKISPEMNNISRAIKNVMQ